MAKKKNETKLTNEDLKNLPRYVKEFNGKGAVIVNRDILKSICDELLLLRETR